MTTTIIELPAPSGTGHGPAYGCPPWCEVEDHDGSDGMPGWTGFDGTYTHAADRGIPTAAFAFEMNGQEYNQCACAALEQRTGEAAPTIKLSFPDDFIVDMTPGEAERYARALLELVAAARNS